MQKQKLLFYLVMTFVLAVTASSSFAQDEPCVLQAGQDPNECPPPGFESWDQVLEEARGQSVNWYFWGGSSGINDFVDNFYGPVLQEEYGITLNRVPVADTVDAVNQVLSEAEAGVAENEGSVDLIWINGENFYTLLQGDLLYGPWAQNIPNSVLVDWDNPALNRDNGIPINGYESPWAGFVFHFMYDTARMDAESLPKNYAELEAWIMENPGRFAYMAPGPGAFQGTRFVKQLLFEISGGQEQWVGEFDQALYDEWAPVLWEKLNAWEPYLWRQGEVYPTSATELNQLFANGEIDFAITQRYSGAAAFIASGEVPPTSSAFIFEDNMIGDYSYVAIPYNAPNRAAALVLADLILRPDLQALQVVPENGAGFGLAIDPNRIEDQAQRDAIDEAFAGIEGAAPPAELTAALVSEVHPEYNPLLEADWEANVLRN